MNTALNNSSTLYIKNMVCNRCIKVVKEELENFGLQINRIVLGEVDLDKPLDNNLINKRPQSKDYWKDKKRDYQYDIR